jgi:hypothetical protein
MHARHFLLEDVVYKQMSGFSCARLEELYSYHCTSSCLSTDLWIDVCMYVCVCMYKRHVDYFPKDAVRFQLCIFFLFILCLKTLSVAHNISPVGGMVAE